MLTVRSKPSVRPLLFILCLSATPLAAQDPVLTVSASPGLAIPIGDFANGTAPGEGVEAGPALTVAFTLHGDGWRSWYAGFSQKRFGCEEAGCAPGDRYRATGFNLGLLAVFAKRRPVQPFVKVGAITTRVETRSLPAPNGGVSDLGFGVEAGIGVTLMAQSPVALTPTLTAASITSSLPGGTSLQLRYLTAALAIVFAF